MRSIFSIIFFVLILAAPITLVVSQDEKPKEDVEGKVKTVYGPDGRPINQSQYAKGFHRIRGNAKMVDGVDTISINTSTADGSQDVSFLGDSTYFGMARAVVVNGHTYTIVPISGRKFVVMSSDSTDTATVRFTLEGE